RAAQAGVAVRAVSPMFAPGTERPGLVLGFGGFDRARMEAAAQRLADVVGDAAGADSSDESRRRTRPKVVRGQQT
ncbi:PLP-dependent aminotransferase family protein, partial [Paraburkholderia sp. SIMBA_050]